MTSKQFFLLLFISAIWGASYIFMKVLSPVFGPVLSASLRMLVAALALFILFKIQNYKVHWKRDYKLFFIIGLGSAAVPFMLYSYAALYIPASLSVILNSTSPMFGAIFAFLLLGDKLNPSKIVGLLFGTIGVIVVSSVTFSNSSFEIVASIIACVLAATLYGVTGAIIKKYAQHIEPKALTLGGMLISGIAILPLVAISPITGEITLKVVLLLIGFGIFSTAIPYIIYFKLLKEIGPVKALTTTYLMPVFGIVWAILILNEKLELNSVIGLIVILFGIYLLSRKKTKLQF